MATTSNLQGITATDFDNEGQDRFTLRYLVRFDTIQTDPYAALALALAASPDPVPQLRTNYGTRQNIFVESINAIATTENRLHYYYDVVYAVPPVGNQNTGQQDPDPTQRPGERNIEYIASEYVVTQARNVEALPHGDGKGGARAANTLGPIVNAAGKRPDEPIIDTEYNGVLVFTKNYASLGAIDALNRQYQRTTNNSSTLGYEPRRLKYLVTESLGETFEGEQAYWPGQTRVEIKKTTDFIMDNVGYEYWEETVPFGEESAPDPGFRRARDKNGDTMAEPINLQLDGNKGGDNTETITYRHLAEINYNPLFGISGQ